MKALFLDRDGIINTRTFGGYILTPEEFQLIPEIVPLLLLAQRRGYVLIVITNQQGIGKGLMTEGDLDLVHKQMLVELRLNGVEILDVFFCGELADSNSYRRKPNPGMFLDAIEKYGLCIDDSVFIGDSVTDAEAGASAGVRTILVGKHPENLATWQVETIAMAEKIFAENCN